MASAVDKVRKSFDAKTVFSVVAGMALFGGIVYLAVKSGVKPLKAAAIVVKGGK
jgi:hypothetical protein